MDWWETLFEYSGLKKIHYKFDSTSEGLSKESLLAPPKVDKAPVVDKVEYFALKPEPNRVIFTDKMRGDVSNSLQKQLYELVTKFPPFIGTGKASVLETKTDRTGGERQKLISNTI